MSPSCQHVTSVTFRGASGDPCRQFTETAVEPYFDAESRRTKVTSSCWPAGLRLIVRRERPHPGAQLDAFEERDGWRYQVFATTTAIGQLGFLDARHRAHARVEDRIRTGKDTGFGRFPSRSFAIGGLAPGRADRDRPARPDETTLLTDTPELAKAELKALRYRLLHVAARLVRGGRRLRLRLDRGWPWAATLARAFARLHTIPAPT